VAAANNGNRFVAVLVSFDSEAPDTIGAQAVFVPSVVRYSPELTVWLGARALNAAVAVVWPVPPLAIGSVPVTCVAKLTLDSVPPRVKLPDEVTVPDRLMPLTVPVPLTDVTVPAY